MSTVRRQRQQGGVSAISRRLGAISRRLGALAADARKNTADGSRAAARTPTPHLVGSRRGRRVEHEERDFHTNEGSVEAVADMRPLIPAARRYTVYLYLCVPIFQPIPVPWGGMSCICNELSRGGVDKTEWIAPRQLGPGIGGILRPRICGGGDVRDPPLHGQEKRIAGVEHDLNVVCPSARILSVTEQMGGFRPGVSPLQERRLRWSIHAYPSLAAMLHDHEQVVPALTYPLPIGR